MKETSLFRKGALFVLALVLVVGMMPAHIAKADDAQSAPATETSAEQAPAAEEEQQPVAEEAQEPAAEEQEPAAEGEQKSAAEEQETDAEEESAEEAPTSSDKQAEGQSSAETPIQKLAAPVAAAATTAVVVFDTTYTDSVFEPTPPQNITVTVGQPIGQLPLPLQIIDYSDGSSYYVQVTGWYLPGSDDILTPETIITADMISDGQLTVYPEWDSEGYWKGPLSFDKNAQFTVEGDLSQKEARSDQDISLPVLTDPSGEHTFLGWSYSPGVDNIVDFAATGEAGTVYSLPLTLYAVWSGDDDSMATLTVDSNGAGYSQATYTYPAGSYWRNTFYDDFPEGWQQTYEDADGIHYLLGYSAEPDGAVDDMPDATWDANLTIYAIWSEAYPVDAPTITFDYNNETGYTAPNGLGTPYFVTSGKPLSESFMDLSEFPLYKDGQPNYYLPGIGGPTGGNFTMYYNFQGWSTDKGPDNNVNVTFDTPVDWMGNKTVYAVWDEVEVPTGDVFAEPDTVEITSPDDATLRSVNDALSMQYTTSYNITPLLSAGLSPSELDIYFGVSTADGSSSFDASPWFSLDPTSLQVFVDGQEIAVPFFSDIVNSGNNSGNDLPLLYWSAEDSDGYTPILVITDPLLITEWSGKTITIKGQAKWQAPFDNQDADPATLLSTPYHTTGSVWGQTDIRIDFPSQNDPFFWISRGGYPFDSFTIDIPADENPPVTVTHQVTYNSNGGSAITPVSVTIEDGKSLTTLPAPTRDGYTLIGWNTQVNGSGTSVTKDTLINADMTIYAQWEKNEETNPGGNPGDETQITLNLGGGASTGSTTVTAKVGDTFASIGGVPAAPTRDGYTFLEWNTKEDGSGITITADTPITVGMTLYAQWEKNSETKPGGSTGGSTDNTGKGQNGGKNNSGGTNGSQNNQSSESTKAAVSTAGSGIPSTGDVSVSLLAIAALLALAGAVVSLSRKLRRA